MKDLKQAKRTELLAAASLYLSCRQQGFPRTIDEIATGIGLDKNKLGRVQTSLSRDLGLVIAAIKPVSLVGRLCSQLHLPASLIELARDITAEVTRLELLEGAAVNAIAAACIWMASTLMNHTVNLDRLSDACACNRQTLNKHYLSLGEHAAAILPTDARFQSLLASQGNPQKIQDISEISTKIPSPPSSSRKRPPPRIFTATAPFDSKRCR